MSFDFEYMKEEILGILMNIPQLKSRSKIEDEVDETIGAIRKLELSTDLSKEDAQSLGVSQLLVTLSDGMRKFQHKLNEATLAQLHAVFNDDRDEQRKFYNLVWEHEDCKVNRRDQRQDSRNTAKILRQFINYQENKEVDKDVTVKLKEMSIDDRRFEEMKDVDRSNTMVLSEDDEFLIGTSAVVSCVAVIVIGKNSQGQFLFNLGHHVWPTEEIILEQRKRLINKGVRENTIEEIMLGGNKASLPNIAELAMKRGPKMKHINLGMSHAGYDESTSVVVTIKNNQPVIRYATISGNPQVAESQRERYKENAKKAKAEEATSMEVSTPAFSM